MWRSLALVLLALPHAAADDDGAAPAAEPALTAADWTSLATDMAKPWPGLQRANGRRPSTPTPPRARRLAT